MSASAAFAGPAVLYRQGYNVGTDYMALALAASGYTITTVTGALSQYGLDAYDLVVYANQDSTEATGDTSALNTYIAGGGKVIYDDWSLDNVPNIGAQFSGNTDHQCR